MRCLVEVVVTGVSVLWMLGAWACWWRGRGACCIRLVTVWLEAIEGAIRAGDDVPSQRHRDVLVFDRKQEVVIVV